MLNQVKASEENDQERFSELTFDEAEEIEGGSVNEGCRPSGSPINMGCPGNQGCGGTPT